MSLDEIWDLHRRAILVVACIVMVGVLAFLMLSSGGDGGSGAVPASGQVAPGEPDLQRQPPAELPASQGQGAAQSPGAKSPADGLPQSEAEGDVSPMPNVPGGGAGNQSQLPKSHSKPAPTPHQPPPTTPPGADSDPSPAPQEENSGGYGGDAAGGREDGAAGGGAGDDEPGGRQD